MRTGVVAAAAAAAALLAVPSTASARTYTAYAGNPTPPPESAPASTSLNTFFPRRMQVRAGDRVEYRVRTFPPHTVTILGKGAERPRLGMPDPAGGTYSDIRDPQGNPFFFNGRPKFVYNTDVLAPVGSPDVADTGTHSSGFVFPQPVGSGEYTLEFSRPGRYDVLCLIHSGMEQSVRVLRPRARGADRPAKVRRTTAKRSAKLFRKAARAAEAEPPVDTVLVGTERGQSALLEFLPRSLLVRAGTTVTFTQDSPSEDHNIVFIGSEGPDGKHTAEAYADRFASETDLFPTGPGTPNQVSPGYVYGSEPEVEPGTATWQYSGDDLGNGFFWSPLMDGLPGDPASGGLLSTARVKFTQPGTYAYYCAVHGTEMSGTVTVGPAA